MSQTRPRRLAPAALVATVALVCPACLPIPHMQREAPAIEGVVLRDGAPVAGARVRLAVNETGPACTPSRTEIVTDAAGRFRFDETTYFTPAFFYGDRRDHWRLCVLHPEGGAATWTDSGWWGGPPRQHVECNLATQPHRDSVADPSTLPPLDAAEGGCVVRRAPAH